MTRPSTYATADLASSDLDISLASARRTWGDLTSVQREALAGAKMRSAEGPRLDYANGPGQATRRAMHRRGLLRSEEAGARLTAWGLLVREAGGCTRDY